MVINQTARLGDGRAITVLVLQPVLDRFVAFSRAGARRSSCCTWATSRPIRRAPGRHAPSVAVQSTPQQPGCHGDWAVGTQAGRSRHQPQVTGVHHARRQTETIHPSSGSRSVAGRLMSPASRRNCPAACHRTHRIQIVARTVGRQRVMLSGGQPSGAGWDLPSSSAASRSLAGD